VAAGVVGVAVVCDGGVAVVVIAVIIFMIVDFSILCVHTHINT